MWDELHFYKNEDGTYRAKMKSYPIEKYKKYDWEKEPHKETSESAATIDKVKLAIWSNGKDDVLFTIDVMNGIDI